MDFYPQREKTSSRKDAAAGEVSRRRPRSPNFISLSRNSKSPGRADPALGSGPKRPPPGAPGLALAPEGGPARVYAGEFSARGTYEEGSVTAAAAARAGPPREHLSSPICVGSQTPDAQHGATARTAQTRDSCRARGTGARTQASHPTCAYVATDFFFHKIKAKLCAQTHNPLFSRHVTEADDAAPGLR